MKKTQIVLTTLVLLASISCSKDNMMLKDGISQNDSSIPFIGITESYSPHTKTYRDTNGNVLWKRNDQVSIFAGSTINELYQVTDASEGKTSAALNKVGSSGFVAGSDLPANIAYYPYSASNEIAKSGSAYAITVDLPSTQNYVEYSFGNGAFPMAAVTSNESDYNLKFKNALGGLKLQLKGTARISRITVMGNNGETLCGTATLNVSNATTPSIALTDATKTLVTLDCGEGVQLNTETATTFVIALPPITMTGGFTVDIYDTGSGTQQIKSTRSQTITRSALLAMPEISI